jgi:hypothetical protein
MWAGLQSSGKILMFDESDQYENATYTDAVTREMWASFTNGIYYLAYQDTPSIIGDAGWLTRAQRMKILKNVSGMGTWSGATRNPTLVTAGPGQYWEGIANSGVFYCYYFTGTPSATAVSMNLPTGSYEYFWFDTVTWASSAIASGTVSGASPASIAAPPSTKWAAGTGCVLVIRLVGTLDASYPDSNVDDASKLSSQNAIMVSQSFAFSGGELDKVIIPLKKTGTPTGVATVEIYAHSGTYGTSSIPTGTALATAFTLDVSTLTTSFVETTFVFPSGITLAAANYVLQLSYSGGDTSNALWWGQDSSSPTYGGNDAYYETEWVTEAFDMSFYVYKR